MSDSENDSWPTGLTRDLAPFGLRIPPALKERIKKKAEENGRSMNAEIVHVLEREYPEPKDTTELYLEYIAKVLKALEKSDDPETRLQLKRLVEELVTLGDEARLSPELMEDIDKKCS